VQTRPNAIKALIVSRTAFGVAIWAFPGPVGKAFGVDMTRDPLASYLSRLIGARDVALAWELFVTEGDAQRKWLLTCMACDAADTLAAVAAGVNGLPKRTTAMLLAASLGPMVRGGLALREQSSPMTPEDGQQRTNFADRDGLIRRLAVVPRQLGAFVKSCGNSSRQLG
jgi:hypothetical protein